MTRRSSPSSSWRTAIAPAGPTSTAAGPSLTSTISTDAQGGSASAPMAAKKRAILSAPWIGRSGAFACSHAEIAEIVGRSPAAVRQLAHRAREHVAARRPRFAADPAVRRTATERFLRASLEGDLAALLELLAPDATLWADGGGKAKAPLRPIHGADKIARFFVAISAEALPPGASVEIVEVNEGPAAVLVGPAGAIAVLQLDLGDDRRVTDLRLVGNPDKLTGLAALRAGD